MPEHLRLKVEGIPCAGCAIDMETVLLGMDGIINARVGYKEETITIEYDPKEINEIQILSAIMKMGFKAKKV